MRAAEHGIEWDDPFRDNDLDGFEEWARGGGGPPPISQATRDRLAREGKETPEQYAARRMRVFTEKTMRQHEIIEEKKKREEEKELPTIKKPTKDFCILLQQARVAKGWTQKDLALKLGIKAQELQTYENGKSQIPPAVMKKMQRVLGI